MLNIDNLYNSFDKENMKEWNRQMTWTEEHDDFDKIVISTAILFFCLCLSCTIALANNPSLKTKTTYKIQQGVEEVMKKEYE